MNSFAAQREFTVDKYDFLYLPLTLLVIFRSAIDLVRNVDKHFDVITCEATWNNIIIFCKFVIFPKIAK